MRPSIAGRRLGLRALVVGAITLAGPLAGSAFAEPPSPPPVTPPAAPSAAATAPAAGSVAPPSAEPSAVAPSAEGSATSPPVRVAPIPTADETPAASDHDAVVGRIGISARRFDPGPLPLALRAGFGCPAAVTTPCEVTMGALGVRYWTSRNLAWNAGLAFAVGGGRDGTQTLDTYVGLGPVVGLTLLLGNWRHLAIGATPELAVVWFRPGPSAATRSTTIVDLRAALEAELHFGFVGVPALSVGMTAGLGFQYESGPDARVWSIGVVGAESVWGVLSNLFVRYYL
jgi:hypothetical protein